MKHALLVAATFLLLVGCTSRPIYNVEDMVVITGTGAKLSQQEVRRAVVKAAVSKGWSVKDLGPGRVQATVRVRRHMARVVIAYSPRSYSITYRSSGLLGYDGQNIHRSYNRWIRGLEQRINGQFGAL